MEVTHPPTPKYLDGLGEQQVQHDQQTENDAMPSSVPANSSDSPLFKLPPELRNRIYEYSLKEEGEILVTATLRPPALLITNKQIRNEATHIWYVKNRFLFVHQDCGASLARSFGKHVKGIKVKNSEIWSGYGVKVTGVNWDNLMKWCYYIWKDKLQPWLQQPTAARDSVVYAAQIVAYHGRKGTWEDCKAQLDAFRVVAGHVDTQWLN